MIRFRFGRHSEVMSFAQSRAIAREASIGAALQEVGHEHALIEVPTAEDGRDSPDYEADRQSGCTPKNRKQAGSRLQFAGGLPESGVGHAPPRADDQTSTRSSVPIAYSPTDSGAIPVGAIDWTAEAIQTRVRQLVAEHVDFVWRSLRALGVPAGDCDDGCQKVWWVVARKVASIDVGKERSYIFSVVMRVASDMRRSALSQRKATFGDPSSLDNDLISSDPSAEELCDRQRARAVLEQMLGNMPWEQRVVFVMFEVEELGLQEIAEALSVPRGTVASRLRLAREAFNRALARHQERSKHPAARPAVSDPRGRPRPPLHSQERQIQPTPVQASSSPPSSALFGKGSLRGGAR